MTLENITIFIDGKPYNGWQNITLEYSLDSIFGVLRFNAVDNPLIDQTFWKPQSKIEVFTSNQSQKSTLVFSGQIDQYRVNAGPNDINTNLVARSSSAILRDSSPPKNINSSNFSLDAFLNVLTSPYDIDYEIIGETSRNVTYENYNPLSNVEREIKNGLLSLSAASATASENGGIKVFVNKEYEFSENPPKINNAQTASFTIDETIRFRTYESVTGSSFASAEVTDETVLNDKRITRKRVPGTTSDLEAFSNWMKNTAFAKSRSISFTAPAWRHNLSSFRIFMPGQLYSIDPNSPIFSRMFVNVSTWLVHSVQLTQSNPDSLMENNMGTRCNVKLILPEAYENEPVDFGQRYNQVDAVFLEELG